MYVRTCDFWAEPPLGGEAPSNVGLVMPVCNNNNNNRRHACLCLSVFTLNPNAVTWSARALPFFVVSTAPTLLLLDNMPQYTITHLVIYNYAIINIVIITDIYTMIIQYRYSTLLCSILVSFGSFNVII